MSRHSTEQALILTSRLAGEDNRIVTLLGPERGVFEAVLYGGRKSKLRSLVSPWHSGTLWLYHQQTKDSLKIEDFDPAAFRPSLREHIYKNMAASLATELVIKTQAAGEPRECWPLVCGLLDGMELSDEAGCRTGLLRFLWRYLGILGLQADCGCCARCGVPLDGLDGDLGDGGTAPAGRASVYSVREGGFLCPDCHRPGQDADGFVLGIQARRYLALTVHDMAGARRTALSEPSYQELRQLLFHLTNSAVGSRLKTFDSGLGIL